MDHVGEHEPAFRVGVDDLDGLARHRGDDVAGALRVAVRHVLDQADRADRVDLGLAAGERVHQPDDAAGPRHVALHVLHAGGRLDRDAAGVEAHALADEGDRRRSLLAAVPAHHHEAAVVRGALPDAEQRAHAELAHRLDVENLDADAELAQGRGAAGELGRIEHVRRLVDEIARQHDAVGDRLPAAPGAARAGDVGDRERQPRLARSLVALLALGLVAVERVGAQRRAERHVGGGVGLHRPVAEFQHHRGFARGGRNPPHRGPAELDEVLRLALRRLAGADHDQPRRLQAGRRHDIERAAALAGESLGFGRPRHELGCRAQQGPGLGPEIDAIVGEHHENAPGRRRNGAKAEFPGLRHGTDPFMSHCRENLRSRRQNRPDFSLPIPHRPSCCEIVAPVLPSIRVRRLAAVRRGTLRRGNWGLRPADEWV